MTDRAIRPAGTALDRRELVRPGCACSSASRSPGCSNPTTAGRPDRRRGGQGAFARAAMGSVSGRSIVALPTNLRHGTISCIVDRIADGVVSAAPSGRVRSLRPPL